MISGPATIVARMGGGSPIPAFRRTVCRMACTRRWGWIQRACDQIGTHVFQQLKYNVLEMLLDVREFGIEVAIEDHLGPSPVRFGRCVGKPGFALCCKVGLGTLEQKNAPLDACFHVQRGMDYSNLRPQGRRVVSSESVGKRKVVFCKHAARYPRYQHPSHECVQLLGNQVMRRERQTQRYPWNNRRTGQVAAQYSKLGGNALLIKDSSQELAKLSVILLSMDLGILPKPLGTNMSDAILSKYKHPHFSNALQ